MSTPVYGEHGLLASILPGYRERPQQVELSRLINRGIKTNRVVVVEAPTGTGKSLGALIPMLHRKCVEGEDRKYGIVTATKALQDQYMRKELPFLRDKCGYDFDFASIKGMSNYVCLIKAAEEIRERNNPSTTWLKQWIKSNPDGELDKVSREDSFYLAQLEITTDTDGCLRKDCPAYDVCPYFSARNRAWTTDLIVVNYHYFLSHMSLVAEAKNLILLPFLSNVIFDEAHVMKDLIRDFFEYGITRAGIDRIARFVGNRHPDTAEALVQKTKHFFDFFGSAVLYQSNTKLLFGIKREKFQERYQPLRKELVLSEILVDGEIHFYLAAMGSGKSGAKSLIYARKIKKQISNTLDILEKVESLLTDNPHEFVRTNLTMWAERTNDNIGIKTKPVDISGLFSTVLPDVCAQSTYMSATLDLNSFISDLGLKLVTDQPVIAKKLDEVFDYGKNCGLYLPDIGDPNTKEFDDNSADLLARIVELAGGGILGLFTSYKSLETARKRLLDLPPDILRYPVLYQAQGEPAGRLIEEFKQGNRILLGTRSFFQGVDFPGDLCKVVFINQIPFKHHDDPVIQALTLFDKQGWFKREQLPHAGILLKQAAGRLIRTETDTGVIICCDHRLRTKSYGKYILGMLPADLPRFYEWDEFMENLNRLVIMTQ